MLPLRGVQRKGDAIAYPEIGRQVHHVAAGAGQPGRVAVELVPEDRLGLFQPQIDHRILGQILVFAIGVKPGGRTVVEQCHVGFLHADGENNQQPKVIKAHLMTEALQQLLDIAGFCCLGELVDMFPDRIVEHYFLLFRSLSH